jgi:hypothetical protein
MKPWPVNNTAAQWRAAAGARLQTEARSARALKQPGWAGLTGACSSEEYTQECKPKQNPPDELTSVAADDAEYGERRQSRDGPQDAKERARIKQEWAAAPHLRARCRASDDTTRARQQSHQQQKTQQESSGQAQPRNSLSILVHTCKRPSDAPHWWRANEVRNETDAQSPRPVNEPCYAPSA